MRTGVSGAGWWVGALAAMGVLGAFVLVSIEERRFPDGSWDVRGWLPETACEGLPYALRAFFVEGLDSGSPRFAEVPLHPTTSVDPLSLGPGRPPLQGHGPFRFGTLRPLTYPSGTKWLSVSVWPPARTEVQLALSADVALLPPGRVPSRAEAPRLPGTQLGGVGRLPNAARRAGLERVRLRAEGGGCVPLQPCTLWFRFEPSKPPGGGLWRLWPVPSGEGERGEVAVLEEVESWADDWGLQRVRLRMTAPEGSLRWHVGRREGSERDAAGASTESPLGEVETRLPARWGVPWAVRAGKPWVRPGEVPRIRAAAIVPTEEVPWSVDAFMGGCWAFAGEMDSPPRSRDLSMQWSPPTAGLWRVQIRRRPLVSDARVIAWVAVPLAEGGVAAAWRLGLRAAEAEADEVAAEWLGAGEPERPEALDRQLRFVLAGVEGRQEPLPPLRSAWAELGPRFAEALRDHRRRVARGLMAYGGVLAFGLLGAGLRGGRRVRRALREEAAPEGEGGAGSVMARRRGAWGRLLVSGLLLVVYGIVAWLLAGG